MMRSKHTGKPSFIETELNSCTISPSFGASCAFLFRGRWLCLQGATSSRGGDKWGSKAGITPNVGHQISESVHLNTMLDAVTRIVTLQQAVNMRTFKKRRDCDLINGFYFTLSGLDFLNDVDRQSSELHNLGCFWSRGSQRLQ